MRRTIGSQEETRISLGRGPHECCAIPLSLEDRYAIVVRPEATVEESVSIEQQMLRRDRCGDPCRHLLDEGNSVFGRDVFEDDAEPLKSFDQRAQGVL